MVDSSANQRWWISLTATVCLIVLLQSPSANSLSNVPTAYQILEANGLPAGLLPAGVKGYVFNTTSGEFSAYLGHCCSLFGGFYSLRIEPTIKGYISNGMLTCLEGISVKFLFFTLNISDIIRRGDTLRFSVWILTYGYSVDYFEESPRCGCHLNSTPRQVWKLTANPSV